MLVMDRIVFVVTFVTSVALGICIFRSDQGSVYKVGGAVLISLVLFSLALFGLNRPAFCRQLSAA